MKHRYLVVEGPIGCGKTTLAEKLARRLNASLLLEALFVRLSRAFSGRVSAAR